jgi:ADP-L-glycero-D-manno-heptose 6-epimerase
MIVVTGGAGFIGSALSAELNKRGIVDIIIVDQLGSDERWKNLRKLAFADYIESDDFLEQIVADDLRYPVEAIFHLGACSSTTQTDARYLIKNNYEYTKELASWAAEADVRFVYASSAATYGDGSSGFSDKENDLQNLRPLNMYGYSKHLFDLWARSNGLFDQIAGLKYFNVYGPNEYHKAEMRSFALKAFEQIKADGKVRLFKSYSPKYADGEQMRDFVYVKDAVDMTLFFYDNISVNGLYNVGTGKARSWNDLANAIFAAMGREPKIDYIAMPQAIKDKYQYFTQADMSKLRAAGYKKQPTSMEDAVKDYVQNYVTTGEYLGGS